jgi:hypothetical protein
MILRVLMLGGVLAVTVFAALVVVWELAVGIF